ncbi:V-type proton ATPase subunit E [Glycine max]|nr:V-type proton ATPase subunit E [Glycine max]KAH1251535.1 V-type proton ATPase subunit E [Glycine max]
MNDADVSKQIQQMVQFIRQEAEEKANEISVSAEEEFNIEKLQLVEADKKKIRQEYERKERQVEIRKKIEYSMQLNASRIKVLQAQDDVISSMKEAASKELLNVSHHHHLNLLSHHHHEYRNLLKDLIVQCLLRLKEPSVLLRCRKDDLHLVEHVLDSSAQEYAEKANVDPPEIIVDNQVYLPPGPSHHNSHDLYCSGGVVLASRDGKIVCENTLDARLDVVFRKKLPEIRKQLFGQQIQQMVRFIRQEAEEKANEISVSAEEVSSFRHFLLFRFKFMLLNGIVLFLLQEFNIEKLQLVEADKKKIRQEYERKERQVEIRKKIGYSMQLNASRIKVLQAQDDVISSMKEAASKELLNVSHHHHLNLLSHHHHEYRNLLKDLIVQCLLRLKEPSVLLRCRKDDLHLVEHELDSAAQEYAEKANVDPPEIIVDNQVYLPPGPTHHNSHDLYCSGGVVLASRDGKIVCENTLDARLDVVFRKKLPELEDA